MFGRGLESSLRKRLLFMLVSLLVGLLLVPRILAYVVARAGSNETLSIAAGKHRERPAAGHLRAADAPVEAVEAGAGRRGGQTDLAHAAVLLGTGGPHRPAVNVYT